MKSIVKILVIAVLAASLTSSCGRPIFKASAFGGGSGQSGNVNLVEVSPDDAIKYSNVYEFIMHKFPGVEVRRIGFGSYSVRIRGVNSLTGPTEPLLVVDGVPTRDLMGVNMPDVARVEVLKGARAFRYGMEGNNGVIVVTTKRAGN